MSGHSKWNNIKRKKEKTDQQRAKVFTKIGRELAIVVREGGPDPAVNGKLRDVIAKAKANNVPNDNIERIIKKAAGEGSADAYEQIVYEGYGPCGVAVVVETLTDNRNRTAADMRHAFDKCGGNMGQPGSVMFLFERKGQILLDAQELDEEALIEDALNAGALDVSLEDDVYEITTDAAAVGKVADALSQAGYAFLSAEAAYLPMNTVKIDDPALALKMEKLIDMLEENDDVQNIWHNWEASASEEG